MEISFYNKLNMKEFKEIPLEFLQNMEKLKAILEKIKEEEPASIDNKIYSY